jgi:hypothetical protein
MGQYEVSGRPLCECCEKSQTRPESERLCHPGRVHAVQGKDPLGTHVCQRLIQSEPLTITRFFFVAGLPTR